MGQVIYTLERIPALQSLTLAANSGYRRNSGNTAWEVRPVAVTDAGNSFGASQTISSGSLLVSTGNVQGGGTGLVPSQFYTGSTSGDQAGRHVLSTGTTSTSTGRIADLMLTNTSGTDGATFLLGWAAKSPAANAYELHAAIGSTPVTGGTFVPGGLNFYTRRSATNSDIQVAATLQRSGLFQYLVGFAGGSGTDLSASSLYTGPSGSGASPPGVITVNQNTTSIDRPADFLIHNDASTAGGLSVLGFSGTNNSGSPVMYAAIAGYTTTKNTYQTGGLQFFTRGASVDSAVTEKLTLTHDGLVGVGGTGTSVTSPLDVNGDRLRLRTAKTPASASATGNQGEVCWDSSYLYVCTATNTWHRVAHATW